jgi:hypothetical protein
MSKKIETKEEQKEMEKPFDFDTFEIKTLDDYRVWNLHARKAFREAKKHNPRCDPPIPVRVPDESFHKKMKVKFQRFDQPENVLKVNVRNAEIDWRGQLKPGCNYELPLPVIRFLNRLAVPIFAEVKVENGGEVRTETKQVGERNRFSCHLLEVC